MTLTAYRHIALNGDGVPVIEAAGFKVARVTLYS